VSHSRSVKRIHLVLDEDLLEEALKASGARTHSSAVNEALKEYCQLKKVNRIYDVKRIFDLKGSGIWEGDLSEMRRDR